MGGPPPGWAGAPPPFPVCSTSCARNLFSLRLLCCCCCLEVDMELGLPKLDLVWKKHPVLADVRGARWPRGATGTFERRRSYMLTAVVHGCVAIKPQHTGHDGIIAHRGCSSLISSIHPVRYTGEAQIMQAPSSPLSSLSLCCSSQPYGGPPPYGPPPGFAGPPPGFGPPPAMGMPAGPPPGTWA